MRLLAPVRRIVYRAPRRSAPASIAVALIAMLVQLVPVALAQQGSVSGTVTIRKRLTRPAIAATVPSYQRGVGVPLGVSPKGVSPKGVSPKGAEITGGLGTAGDWLAEESARIVIWVESMAGGEPDVSRSSPGISAAIQQVGRRFWPEVVAIPVGGTVSFPNLDPIFHNVFSLSKPKAFDLGNYPMGSSKQVTFQKPGIVYVNCHLHPNMTATIVVVPGSRFTKLGKDGTFSISGITPGDYELVLWHRAIGVVRRSLKISEGEDFRVDLLLPNAESSKSVRNGGSD